MLDPTGIDAYFVGLWIFGVIIIFGAAAFAIAKILDKYLPTESKKPIPAATEDRQIEKYNLDDFITLNYGCQYRGEKVG